MPLMRRYGRWSGNPKGTAEDTTRCVYSVANGWIPAQCSRKRGHGVDGLLCKQHAKTIDASPRMMEFMTGIVNQEKDSA